MFMRKNIIPLLMLIPLLTTPTGVSAVNCGYEYGYCLAECSGVGLTVCGAAFAWWNLPIAGGCAVMVPIGCHQCCEKAKEEICQKQGDKIKTFSCGAMGMGWSF
jgi:hypothetical protein